MPSSHARLSPSASERWLACPASVLAIERARAAGEIPEDESNLYADEGTAAHALAELHARAMYEERQVTKKELTAWRTAHLETLVQLDPDAELEMTKHAEDYADALAGKLAAHPGSVLLLEQKVDTGIPECWGTADATIIGPNYLEVTDYKYGSGVWVAVESNTQFRLYGLGALHTFCELLGYPDEVHLTVHQPRKDNLATEVISTEELLDWGEWAAGIAASALDGTGDWGPTDEACRWCPLSGRCRAQAEAIFRQDFTEEPDLLTPADISDRLDRLASVRDWANALERVALDMAYSRGIAIPGYKVVRSGGVRQIADEPAAVDLLTAAGYDRDACYTTPAPKLLGIGALEKLVGKANFTSLLGPVVTKTVGKEALVPESDPRAPISPESEGRADFATPIEDEE